ncbi:RNA polymerase sigma factor [bacterium]|nr:MAG: RNA polymerase sigma factor [bacterium]
MEIGLETEERIREAVDHLYRTEGARVLATLIRLLGDFESAEDARQEAFSAALRQWPRDGIPVNPRAWLISAGRFRAIDTIRRESRLHASLQEQTVPPDSAPEIEEAEIKDDGLRLIFICCHPALPRESQVALTLREVCGLSTEEIARSFLDSTVNVAQRIVRAKAKIRKEAIPYELPALSELPERLDNVLRVAYLVFNEGYYASTGYSLTRQPLSSEAIRLGRLLLELIPEPEVIGLLALMLLSESRRSARTSPSGDLILLDDQDRSRWNGEMIAEGQELVRRAWVSGAPGPYVIQAAIAATHAESPTAAETDWSRIVRLYGLLLQRIPSPVVELNRAVAVAMCEGFDAGLAIVDRLMKEGELDAYGLAHATRADFCRRLGMNGEAHDSYRRALDLATQEPERRFLLGRLAEVAP